MKKFCAVAVVMLVMLVGGGVHAYQFGSVLIDPNVSLQKMSMSEWYPDERPTFFGSKLEAGLMWNKVSATQGFMTMGIDRSLLKAFILTNKAGFGLNQMPGSDVDRIAMGVAYDATHNIFIYTQSTKSGLLSANSMEIASENNIEIDSGSSILLEANDDITLNPSGTLTLNNVDAIDITQMDLPGTCSTGQIKIDTGGASTELCYCLSANTWGCLPFVPGGGPAD